MKAVLITDSIMRTFDVSHFSRLYDVKVVNRSSFKTLKDSLPQTLEVISTHNPDVVYIHLGVNDIAKDRSPADISSDLVACVDRILRDTPQYCSIVVSHILPSSETTRHDRICATRKMISSSIRSKTSCNSSNSSVLWERVKQNYNSNFFTGPRNLSCNIDMFVRDLVHLNERGVRVIMGNFRTVLKDLRSSQ